MSSFEHAALLFLQASLTSLIAGFAMWAALRLALRHRPALAVLRAAWLLPQLLIVATFLLMLLPQTAGLSLVPAITINASAPVNGPAIAATTEGSDAGFETALVADSARKWLTHGAQAWLLIYAAGLGIAIAKLMRAQRTLRNLRRASSQLHELDKHAGFHTHRSAPGIAIFETDACVSPMVVGVRNPYLLLPRHLRHLDVEQQQLVIAHELAHVSRLDHLWRTASVMSYVVLWFNPLVRLFGDRLALAQELSCDQFVLRGRPQTHRRAYAAALLAQLKLQHSSFGAALAFGGDGASPVAARMMLIRQNGNVHVDRLTRAVVLAAVAAIFWGSVLVQPVLAWQPESSPTSVQPAVLKWHAPLERIRVSSFFGAPSASHPRGHRGIDFATSTGTPVLAGAAGTVIEASDLHNGEAKYGKTIVIDHGGTTRTVYAHLDHLGVAVGDVVAEGQVIGRSGATGKVTGPHLHFEVWEGDQAVNPETRLPGLAANATAAALHERLISQQAH